MRHLRVLVPLLAFSASIATGAELNPHGRVFTGDGIIVEMATYVEKNDAGLRDALLKITGGPAYDAGLDGKVIKYTAVRGQNSVRYVYPSDKSQTGSLARMEWRRAQNGSPASILIFLESEAFTVRENEELSRKSVPAALLDRLRSGQ